MVDVRQQRILCVRVRARVCLCVCARARAQARQRCLNDVFQTLHLFTSVPVTVTAFPKFVSLTTNKTPMTELYTFIAEARA